MVICHWTTKKLPLFSLLQWKTKHDGTTACLVHFKKVTADLQYKFILYVYSSLIICSFSKVDINHRLAMIIT